MSSKLSIALLAVLMMGSAVHAAPPTAKPRVVAPVNHAENMKTIEDFQKEYKAKNGDMSKIEMSRKRAFITAIKSYSDLTPGLTNSSLMRLYLAPEFQSLQGKDILAEVQNLAKMRSSGVKEQVEAANLKIELMELAGFRLDASNMNKKEFEALRVLLAIDVQAVPKAVPLMKKIVENLRKGPSVMTVEAAVTEGMKGMKGTLEDFINLCSKV